MLRAQFPPYRDTPITLAVRGDAGEAERVARAAAEVPGAADVGPPRRLRGDTYAIDVVSKNGVRVTGMITEQLPNTESTVAGDIPEHKGGK